MKRYPVWFEACHIASPTSWQAMLQISAAESHGEKAWHPAFSRAALPGTGLMLDEQSVKEGMRCVGTAIAQQGEVLAPNQLAIKTTFLVFRPWSLEHNLGERFQSHQDTSGSSGYSDSTPWGSRSAVDTPRFKAFGMSSWLTQTTHKSSWDHTYRNSIQSGERQKATTEFNIFSPMGGKWNIGTWPSGWPFHRLTLRVLRSDHVIAALHVHILKRMVGFQFQKTQVFIPNNIITPKIENCQINSQHQYCQGTHGVSHL